MKKYTLIITAFVLFLTSCKKDTEGISKETQFAAFTMSGDQYMSLVKGATFTDPGVTAKEGTVDLTVAVKGQVNTNEVGVYDIVYSAVNKDGYPGSVSRTVAILPSAEESGVDISGSYKNDGTFDYTAVWTKLAPGFYLADNVWGGSSKAVISSYILSVDGKTLLIPVNSLTGYGRVRGTGTLTGSNVAFTLDLLDQGVAGSKKKWIKL